MRRKVCSRNCFYAYSSRNFNRNCDKIGWGKIMIDVDKDFESCQRERTSCVYNLSPKITPTPTVQPCPFSIEWVVSVSLPTNAPDHHDSNSRLE